MSSDFYTNFILPHAGIIIKICRAYTSTEDDFEDYYQEVCLQIWRSRQAFKGNSQWSTWIYRLSLNVCLTLFKKQHTRDRQFIHSESIPEFALDESGAFTDEDLNRLYAAIKMLSDTDRAIIILFLEEKKYAEIAEIIGTNANNIGVRVQRIKERLKKILTKNNRNESIY